MKKATRAQTTILALFCGLASNSDALRAEDHEKEKEKDKDERPWRFRVGYRAGLDASAGIKRIEPFAVTGSNFVSETQNLITPTLTRVTSIESTTTLSADLNASLFDAGLEADFGGFEFSLSRKLGKFFWFDAGLSTGDINLSHRSSASVSATLNARTETVFDSLATSLGSIPSIPPVTQQLPGGVGLDLGSITLPDAGTQISSTTQGALNVVHATKTEIDNQNPSVTASIDLEQDIDVDIIALRLGPSWQFSCCDEKLNVSIGAGPVFNFTDTSVRLRERVSLPGIGVDERQSFATDTPVLIGYYAELILSYQFSERFGLYATFQFQGVEDLEIQLDTALASVDFDNTWLLGGGVQFRF